MGNVKVSKKKSSLQRAIEILILLAFGFLGGYAYDNVEYQECQRDNVELRLEIDSLNVIYNK